MRIKILSRLTHAIVTRCLKRSTACAHGNDSAFFFEIFNRSSKLKSCYSKDALFYLIWESTILFFRSHLKAMKRKIRFFVRRLHKTYKTWLYMSHLDDIF